VERQKWKHILVSDDIKKALEDGKGDMSHNDYQIQLIKDAELGKRLDVIIDRLNSLEEEVKEIKE